MIDAGLSSNHSPESLREQRHPGDRRSLDKRLGSALPFVAVTVVLLEFLWIARWYWSVISRGGEGWQTGDWLINFAGGPVRRGASGELIFKVFAPDQVLVGTFWIQIGFLFALCMLSLLLYLKSPQTAAWFALTLSPAFLLFPFLSPEGGLRKELIGLTAFAWLALSVRLNWGLWRQLPAMVLFFIGLAAHEVTLFMTPAFIFLLFQLRQHDPKSPGFRATLGAYVLAPIVALMFYLSHPGSSAETNAVCASWESYQLWDDPQKLEMFCNSALAAIGDSTLDAVRATAGNFPSYFLLLSLVVLACVPFYFLQIRRQEIGYAGVQVAALTPLFVVGTDYGRWIFIFFSLLSLVLLASSNQYSKVTRRMPSWAALLYVSLWSLPYAGTPTGWSLFGQVVFPIYQSVAELVVHVTPWLG